MHGEGRFSLIRLFTSFASVGAEWVMWVLVALSVFSIAIMLERARFYATLSDNLDQLAIDLRALLAKSDIAGARTRLERSPSPAATVALAGLGEGGPGAAEEAIEGAKVRARMSLERNLTFLATVGNNAPFVGLLGTVIGIIQSFQALNTGSGLTGAAAQAAQQAAQQRVMGSIAEALVATAIGLFVAIPAVAAFNFFQRKVRSIVSSSDGIAHVVMAHIKTVGEAHGASPRAVVATGRDS